MERLSINYRHNTFGPDIADECTLRAVIGSDGLSFAVKDKRGQCQYLHTWVYKTEQREHALRKILNTEEVAAYPFGAIELLHFPSLVTVVPHRMFDAELAAEYLKTLTDQPVSRVEFGPVPNLDLVTVWSLDASLTAISSYFFPKATNISYPLALLSTLQQHFRGMSAVCVVLRSSILQVVVFERGNLLFFNSFTYEKPVDVLYFTLLVYEQFHFKPLDIPLYIAGELLQESDIYRQYERFIRHLHFLPSTALSGISEGILPHIYIDQTIR